MTDKLNLSEAAAEILKSNLASKKGMPPEKLDGKTSQISTKHLDSVDVEDIKKATPPGATPPVGAEPMKKLGKQPASGDCCDNVLPPVKVTKENEEDEDGEEFDQIAESKADELGEKLHSLRPDQMSSVVQKAPTKHLQYLHHWNMGLSGGRDHPAMPHIEKELKKRGKLLSREKSERLFGESETVNELSGAKGGMIDRYLNKLAYDDPGHGPNPRKKGFDLASGKTNQYPFGPKAKVPATNLPKYEEYEEEVNEDIAALMAGENLSEDFQRKATAIFEAAVKAKVSELAEELEAKYVAQFEEAYSELKEDLESKVDEYLDYVVESWMDENKLAVESGLKTEIVESFIGSLKSVFEEHYIDIPEEKVDVVEELASKVEALEKQVNEEMSKNIDLKQKLAEQKKVEALFSVCEGLTLSQAEKIKSIAESVEFTSEEEFKSQMENIKESYFPKETVKAASTESLNDQVQLTEEEVKGPTVDPKIAAYASIISKTLIK
jgi:hypothetical protein